MNNIKSRAKKIVKIGKTDGKISLNQVVSENRSVYPDLIEEIMTRVERHNRRHSTRIFLVA